MSQPTKVSVLKQNTLDHYAQLCADYQRTPTTAQIEQITSAVGDVAVSVAKRFVYELLYFVPRSAVVFDCGCLFVGWIHKPDGTKQEIWFRRIGTKGHVYYHDLMSGLSAYLPEPDARLCDEWHPSLDAMCKPWQTAGRVNRQMLYALFNATIKIMDTDPLPPSIEDIVPTDEHAESSQPKAQDRTENALTRPIRKTRRQAKRARENEDEDYNPTASTACTRSLAGGRTRRSNVSVTVDLTESDSEADSKSEQGAVPIPTRHEDQPATSLKQELLDILESKEVPEIEDMLAKRSGQLPSWIERVAKEEMEKKMARDLAMIKNLF